MKKEKTKERAKLSYFPTAIKKLNKKNKQNFKLIPVNSQQGDTELMYCDMVFINHKQY